MTLSTHKVEVVRVHLEPHPNADSLSIVHVYGYPVCVRTQDWQDGDLGAYVPPDSVVDLKRPEFAFLASGIKEKHRVRTVKLRGVQSFGLLIHAPEVALEGDDLAEFFGVEHYEPELKGACTGGEAEAAPAFLSSLSKYDMDALRRYASVFEPGEMVMVTEKIHGANARYCYMDGRMWCGSRSQWKAEDPNCLWWKALRAEPRIEEFCRTRTGCVLYGEVYGRVQCLHYGVKDVAFAAFDVLKEDGCFLDARDNRAYLGFCRVPQVPVLAHAMPFDFDTVCAMAEGFSTVPGADHVREGCVVKPIHERFHQSIGRVQLKVVGAGYLAL